MNGNYTLDTNIVIYALNNQLFLPKQNYFISIITEMELLSFNKLSANEEIIIKNLLTNFTILEINQSVKNKTIELRKKYNIKLPDSIILASSFVNNSTLITNDKQLKQVEEVKIMTIEEFINA